MASTKPIKGILKKSPAPGAAAAATAAYSASSSSPATHSRRQRTAEEQAEIARKHAAIIQQRRELEAVVFQNIERLTDFPLMRGDGITAAQPAAQDANDFLQLVRIFQPGDYDDLIEERNTCGRCGYALCPRPRQTFPGRGTWKLVNTGTKDFGIVQKSELEKWCTPACARRALYIKVQLNETAAWERVGIPDIQVELLPEPEPEAGAEPAAKNKSATTTTTPAQQSEADLTRDMARLKLNEERRLAQNAQALALERGDHSMRRLGGGGGGGDDDDDVDENGRPARIVVPPAPAALVDIDIVEKKVIMAPTAPTLESAGKADGKADGTADGTATSGTAGGEAHMLVEGHRTRFASK